MSGSLYLIGGTHAERWADARYSYALTAACPDIGPGDTSTCNAANQSCATKGKSGMHEYIWRSESAPEVLGATITGDICESDLPAPISVATVSSSAREYEEIHMPVPVPEIEPHGYTSVNLPVLVSVHDVGDQYMTVSLPVRGFLRASPTYSWTFDHDPTPLVGAGREYEDGFDPRYVPDHYLSHTYRKAQIAASVTLTVTWKATFTAAGHTVTVPNLAMPGITTTFPVYEAHAVLVGG